MKSIPTKDVDFNLAQNNISNTANDKRVAWNLNSDWLTDTLFPAKEAWTEAWGEYQDPAGRTKVITAAKNDARKNYEKPLRLLIKNLQVNPAVTDDELRRLGIAVPSSTRTPAPVPTTYPVASVDSSVLRRLGIRFHDSATTSLAKPKGVHGAEIKWGIADAMPDDPDELPHSSFDTHTPFVLEFTGAERGKTVYFCLRWENTTGAKGPWGEMNMAIVP